MSSLDAHLNLVRLVDEQFRRTELEPTLAKPAPKPEVALARRAGHRTRSTGRSGRGRGRGRSSRSTLDPRILSALNATLAKMQRPLPRADCEPEVDEHDEHDPWTLSEVVLPPPADAPLLVLGAYLVKLWVKRGFARLAAGVQGRRLRRTHARRIAVESKALPSRRALEPESWIEPPRDGRRRD